MWPTRVPRLSRNILRILVRSVSRTTNKDAPLAAAAGVQSRMSGWELQEYGDFAEVLQFHSNLRMPKIEEPRELIVKVTAASVNPLDLAMSGNIFKQQVDIDPSLNSHPF